MANENRKLIGRRGGSIASGAKTVHPVDKIVGENVRRLRLQCGMSQEQLGIQSGVTFQQIQKYEKGTNRVSASRLDGFAQLFNVDHNAFFTGVPSAGKTAPEVAAGLTLSARAFKLARLFDELGDRKKQKAIYSLVAEMAGDTVEAADNLED